MYVLRLTASDTMTTNSDTVTITVRKAWKQGELLFWLTGNHLGALPLYDELSCEPEGTLVVQFDAHLDVPGRRFAVLDVDGSAFEDSAPALPGAHQFAKRRLDGLAVEPPGAVQRARHEPTRVLPGRCRR